MDTHSNHCPEWSIGDRLRKVRRNSGMSQRDFARALGANEITYASWETDRHHMAHEKLIEIAYRIQKLTGTPIAWFGLQDVPTGLHHPIQASEVGGAIADLAKVLEKHRPNKSSLVKAR